MKLRPKKMFVIVLAVAGVLALVGALLKDFVARKIVLAVANSAGRAAGGFEVELDGLHMGLLAPTFEVTGLRVLNPSNYPVRACMEMKRLFVRRASLWGGAEIPEIDIDLTRLVVIRRQDGQMNVERLVEAQSVGPEAVNAEKPAVQPSPAIKSSNSAAPKPPASAAPGTRTKADRPTFTIRKLRVKVDRLDYHDYSLGAEPMVIPVEIRFDQTFENVTDIADLAGQLQAQLLVGDLFGGTNGPARAARGDGGGGGAVERQIEDVIRGL